MQLLCLLGNCGEVGAVILGSWPVRLVLITVDAHVDFLRIQLLLLILVVSVAVLECSAIVSV